MLSPLAQKALDTWPSDLATTWCYEDDDGTKHVCAVAHLAQVAGAPIWDDNYAEFYETARAAYGLTSIWTNAIIKYSDVWSHEPLRVKEFVERALEICSLTPS